MDARAEAYLQGDYTEAEKQFAAALKEAEQFAPKDPRLATGLNSLAEVYRAQGRYAEAEPLYKRSLAKHRSETGVLMKFRNPSSCPLHYADPHRTLAEGRSPRRTAGCRRPPDRRDRHAAGRAQPAGSRSMPLEM